MAYTLDSGQADHARVDITRHREVDQQHAGPSPGVTSREGALDLRPV